MVESVDMTSREDTDLADSIEVVGMAAALYKVAAQIEQLAEAQTPF